MPVYDGYEQGTPSWIDISTKDIESSKAFYARLFGWTWEGQTGPEGEFIYSIASKDGHMVCGLGPATQEVAGVGVPTVLNTYIAVDSVDAVYAAALDAGGTSLVEPFDVTDAGRVAYVADDQGAHVGLWQAGSHKGAELANEPGAYTWAELLVPDTEKAVRFYAAAFGMGTEVRGMGEMNYTCWTAGGRVVGGTMPPPMKQGLSHWHVYFGAADTDACVAKAQDLGAEVVVSPLDIPVGRTATLHDPQGGTFSVIAFNAWQTE